MENTKIDFKDIFEYVDENLRKLFSEKTFKEEVKQTLEWRFRSAFSDAAKAIIEKHIVPDLEAAIIKDKDLLVNLLQTTVKMLALSVAKASTEQMDFTQSKEIQEVFNRGFMKNKF